MSKQKGNIGEDRATTYLQQKGYVILDRNYHTRGGEIDIIASIDDTIVFVEVKTGHRGKFGSPIEWVTSEKVQRIVLSAREYIFKKNITGFLIRFDIVAITDGKLEHIPNAFDAS
jgi:putative endonuclease